MNLSHGRYLILISIGLAITSSKEPFQPLVMLLPLVYCLILSLEPVIFWLMLFLVVDRFIRFLEVTLSKVSLLGSNGWINDWL